MGLSINENLGIIKLKRVPILLCDRVGINKNLYPCDVVKEAIEEWKNRVKIDGTYRYVFYKHPKDNQDSDIEKIAGAVEDIYIDEEQKIVYADINLFPNKHGEFIYFLLKNGYTIGLSIRGGESNFIKDYYTLSNGEKLEVRRITKLVLQGVDFVVFPSYIITQATKDNIAGRVQPVFEQSQSLKLPSNLTCQKFDENGKCLDYILDFNKNEVYDFEKIEYILEQTITKDNIKIEEINLKNLEQQETNTKKTFKNFEKSTTLDSSNNNTNKEVNNMSVEQKQQLELEIKKLELEKLKLETELEKIKEQYNKELSKLESIKKQLQNIEKDLEVKKSLIAEILKQESQVKELEKRKQELEQEIEELEGKFETIKEQTQSQDVNIEELRKQIEGELRQKYENEIKEQVEEKLKKVLEQSNGEYVTVKCCDKKFDNENPPKIRVVDVKETVSTKRWGTIDHDITRKLVWLTHDIDIAKQVFGVIRNKMKTWKDLKYPVYEHRKSENSDYDVDLVLNINGLRTALLFALGRPAQYLTRKEKAHLFTFLYEKYKQLKDAGIIEDIPQVLKNIVGRAKVLEQVEIKINGNPDHYLVPVIENLYLTGVIDFDIDKDIDYTTEQVEVEFNEEDILSAFSKAFGGNSQTVLEQDYSDMDNTDNDGDLDDVIQVNTENLEELLNTLFEIIKDTEDAKNFGIETYDDFYSNIQEIRQLLEDGQIEDGLNKLLQLNEVFEPYDVLRYLIIAIIKTPSTKSKNSDNENNNSNEPQQTQNVEDNNTDTQQKQENNSVKPLEQYIKKLAKEELGYSEDEIKDVKEFIETLIKDYKYLWIEHQEQQLEKVKEQALEELEPVLEQVDETTKEEIIEEIMSAEDEEKIEELLEKYKEMYAIEDDEENDTNKDDENQTDDNKLSEVKEQGKGLSDVNSIINDYKQSKKEDERYKDIIDFLKQI